MPTDVLDPPEHRASMTRNGRGTDEKRFRTVQAWPERRLHLHLAAAAERGRLRQVLQSFQLYDRKLLSEDVLKWRRAVAQQLPACRVGSDHAPLPIDHLPRLRQCLQGGVKRFRVARHSQTSQPEANAGAGEYES